MTGRYRKDPESRRRWRRTLASRTPAPFPCYVPGCKQGIVNEDCCYRHNLDVRHEVFRTNDGIVDELAIDIARQGIRVVGLTWVEYEIAVAHMFNAGVAHEEIARRTGVKSKLRPARTEGIRRIADALRSAA
jgi:hypothetical protein